MRNLGNDERDTTVRLRHTKPHAAANSWDEAFDVAGEPCVDDTIVVPALASTEVSFQWRLPKARDVDGATRVTISLLPVGRRFQ